MEILAIIPARGGSKGIPRKNIRNVGGKPLLAHSIEHAWAAPEVTRVVVSTDDAEIAEIARQHRAGVVMRPAEISGDAASSESALQHTLNHLRETEQYRPDLVVFLQATSPLRRTHDVRDAIRTLESEGADSLFSAGPVHGFVWRVENGRPRSFSYDFEHRPRRQDAPEDLIENGSIYIFKPWVIEQHGNRLGGKIAVYRMEALYSFQIDEPSDLHLFEALFQAAASSIEKPDLAHVELLVLDFDGVLTDNRVLVSQDGTEAVLCSRADGLGIELLTKAGIPVVVLSKERNPVVAARCRKLGIECVQACDEKLGALQHLAATRNLQPSQVAYVGNDINDLACLAWVGCPIGVADALPEVRRAVLRLTTRPGGFGAVREVADWILTAKASRLPQSISVSLQ